MTIRPLAPLPEIYDAATLDGTTQTGYAGVPLVEIDGSLAGDPVSGLTIAGSGSTIRGLAVTGFGSSGIKLRGGSANRIVGCFLGIEPTGRSARGNLLGVLVEGGDGNTIGGTGPADRNVISGNNCCGVNIRGAHGTTLIGNFIGTDATGTRAVANSGSGVVVFGGSGTTIGGTEPGSGNLISGNGTDPFADAGILYVERFVNQGGQVSDRIEGNRIGTDVSGTLPVPNRGSGVRFGRAYDIAIGGRSAAAGNLIAYNAGAGVRITGGYGIPVLSNAMHDNGGGGILFDYGPVPPAVRITSVSSDGETVRVTGGIDFGAGAAGNHWLVQLFANSSCPPPELPSGERYLGEVELSPDSTGIAYFDEFFPGSIPAGGGVSVTLTWLELLTTSSYGACEPDSGGCARPFVTVAPRALDVRSGTPATITFGVLGSEPLHFQWFRQENGLDFEIPGVTGPTLVTPPLRVTTQYIVRITNPCETIVDNSTVTVCDAPPVIAREPSDSYVPAGTATSLSVALAIPANYSYQWYSGDPGDTSNPIAAATTDNLTVVATSEPQAFWVRASNGCGSVASRGVRVVAGPVIESASVVASPTGALRLVIKGSGFSTYARVRIGDSGFEKPAKVRNERTCTQKGSLGDGRSIAEVFPVGQAVTVTLENPGGYSTTISVTR